MQFHTFKLDEESSWLCVIVTPFGKFRLARLPMDFLDSPSWAQGAMEELFEDLPDVEVNVDDVGIFSPMTSKLIAKLQTRSCLHFNHMTSVSNLPNATGCNNLLPGLAMLHHLVVSDLIQQN